MKFQNRECLRSVTVTNHISGKRILSPKRRPVTKTTLRAMSILDNLTVSDLIKSSSHIEYKVTRRDIMSIYLPTFPLIFLWHQYAQLRPRTYLSSSTTLSPRHHPRPRFVFSLFSPQPLPLLLHSKHQRHSQVICLLLRLYRTAV